MQICYTVHHRSRENELNVSLYMSYNKTHNKPKNVLSTTISRCYCYNYSCIIVSIMK